MVLRSKALLHTAVLSTGSHTLSLLKPPLASASPEYSSWLNRDGDRGAEGSIDCRSVPSYHDPQGEVDFSLPSRPDAAPGPAPQLLEALVDLECFAKRIAPSSPRL